MAATKAKHSKTYTEIFIYFLRLGVLGFGGPFAVMAAIRRDLVDRRKWMTDEKFAKAIALIKALPGPTATQLSIYSGYVRGGRLGGVLAGVGLIFPSFLMMLALAAFYDSVEALRWTGPMMNGMQAAAIGVILESVWQLAQPFRARAPFWLVAAAAGAITMWRPSIEPIVIVGAGILGVVVYQANPSAILRAIVPPFFLGGTQIALPLVGRLGGVALKAGAFTFGTGLAIVPLLSHDVVDKYQWLSQRQFLDALAFGQITPGPVVITVTFIGYKVAGLLGAVLATVGVFTPAFINILTWFPVAEEKLSKSPHTKNFIMFAMGAVVGSIVIAMAKLTASQVGTGGGLLWAFLITGALVAMLKTRLPVWVVIPLGGLLAVLLALLTRPVGLI